MKAPATTELVPVEVWAKIFDSVFHPAVATAPAPVPEPARPTPKVKAEIDDDTYVHLQAFAILHDDVVNNPNIPEESITLYKENLIYYLQNRHNNIRDGVLTARVPEGFHWV